MTKQMGAVKKIIPCLDVRNGKVVKGQKFDNIVDIDNPVVLAKYYNDNNADELVFYDITASVENRALFTDVFKQVRAVLDIPLTVGGGINTLADCDKLFCLGADKLSINSGAIKNIQLISQASQKYGSQKIVVSMDVKQVLGSYKLFSHGGKQNTNIDAIAWAKKCQDMGAGSFVINSISNDGEKNGYDIAFLQTLIKHVSLPVVASGGAGSIQHFVDLFQKVPQVSAALAASVFHYKEIDIKTLKTTLIQNGINIML